MRAGFKKKIMLRDIEKDINIKVLFIAHALVTLKIQPQQGIELFMRAELI
jgi:hypothetical protein